MEIPSPEPVPTTLSGSEHAISLRNISPAAGKVMCRLKEGGYIAYLAGGGVRDLLLERQPKDFDIATDATPEQIRKLFRNCRMVGRRFRLVHIHFRNEIIETSTFRAPVPEDDTDVCDRAFRTGKAGLVMRDNIFGTPAQDALRRDFTINALFFNIADLSVIDYAGGLADLGKKTVRTIGDPDKRFAEDPVRMIRAARFAGTLGFQIEPADFEAIQRNAYRLEQASSSRMYEEVKKLFFCGHARTVYEWLEKADLIHPMFRHFSRWMDKDEKRHNWVIQTLEQMDRWRKAKLDFSPALLFALLFGEYHETLIADRAQHGYPLFESARLTVHDHLKQVCGQVRIPRTVIYQVCDIMTNQYRLRKMKGARPGLFMQSPGFPDAFLYLKLSAKAHHRDHAIIDFWNTLRKTSSCKKRPPGKSPPRHRPRRP